MKAVVSKFIGIGTFLLLLLATTNAYAACGCGRGVPCEGSCLGGGTVLGIPIARWCTRCGSISEGGSCGLGSGNAHRSCESGTICSNPLGSGTCVTTESIDEGDPCGTGTDNWYRSCEAGTYCSYPLGTGTCVTTDRIPEGGTCGAGSANWGRSCAAHTACTQPFGVGECAQGGSGDACTWLADGPGQGSCQAGLVCDATFVCRHDPPVAGESCSIFVPCAEGHYCKDLVCNKSAAVAEACEETYQCVDGLLCQPCDKLEGCPSGGKACYPSDEGSGVYGASQCKKYFSSVLYDEAVDSGLTKAYGTGYQVPNPGIYDDYRSTWTGERGVVYGSEGHYGCYWTKCTGYDSNASISLFISRTTYPDYFETGYNNVEGDSWVLGASAGVGEYASVTTAQVISPYQFLMPLGQVVAYSFGQGLPLPGALTWLECETTLSTVYSPVTAEAAMLGAVIVETNDPPVAVCAEGLSVCADSDECRAEASIDGGSYDPDMESILLDQSPYGPYPLGDSVIDLTVTDLDGASDTCSATLNVADCTAPELDCPQPVVECAGPGGTPVSYAVTATDNCSGDRPADCAPLSGSLYPLGASPVSCGAVDDAGNPGQCTGIVTVVDTTPPEVACPEPQTVECSAPAGAPVEFIAGAQDLCEGALTPACTPHSGSVLGVGVNPVTCTVADSSGNAAQCAAAMTVVDTTAPVLSCNAPARITPPDAPVSFRAGAADVCEPGLAPAVTGFRCIKLKRGDRVLDVTNECAVTFSGDTLTIDETAGVGSRVRWSVEATDAAGNRAAVECEVEVVRPGKR